MTINEIVKVVNDKLAGEMLSYDMIKIHLDAVIDDINARLNAKFPVFSEFSGVTFPLIFPNYNFFPDKYVRKVVCTGVAYKFYATDEEGAQAAPQYMYDYKQNLFEMERDYIMMVPEEYQADAEQGSIKDGVLYDADVDFSNLW